MPRNGSGTYTLPAGNPVVTGTTISSTVQNNTTSDIATALTNSIAKDGQTTPTANLPMGTYKLTGLGSGSAATDSVNLGQVQAGATTLLSSVSGTDTITAVANPTLTAYATGNTFRFASAGANTGAVTINIDGLGAKDVKKFGSTALVAGDIPSGAAVELFYDGTQFQLIGLAAASVSSTATATTQSAGDNSTKIATTAYVDRAIALRGYIDGLTLSTAGSSSTISIAAGGASDSTNVFILSLASSISKTTSAWSVGTGNGGLDTGSIANSTWYYFYLIRRTDTGVVDVVFSTSSSSPTLPTNYTQYRYIGAGLTNGSAQWTAFTQSGNEFYWSTPVLDVSGACTTSATTVALSVPRGRKMKVFLNVRTTTGLTVYLSDPANADLAPSSSANPLGSAGNDGVGGLTIISQANVWTDTSAQIRYRGGTTAQWGLATLGWFDDRGKNA